MCTKRCPFCNELFKARSWNNKYCCYDHRSKYYSIIHTTKNEICKLEKDELIIWKEYPQEE